MASKMTRRVFLKMCAMGALAASLPAGIGRAFGGTKRPAADEQEPLFFLNILVPGGWDTAFLFDARGEDMWQAKLMHSFLRDTPKVWSGKNGQDCLASNLAWTHLNPLKDYFSVINGMVMHPINQGHPDNWDFFLTGALDGVRPFYQNLLVPEKQTDYGKHDFMRISGRPLNLQPRSLQQGLDLSTRQGPANGSESNQVIADFLSQAAMPDPERSPLDKHILQRMHDHAQGSGLHALGAQHLVNSFLQAREFGARFSHADVDSPLAGVDADYPDQSLVQALKAVRGYFREGVCKSIALTLSYGRQLVFDTHTAASARRQYGYYEQLVRDIAAIINFLRSEDFDGERKLIDVVAFMVNSEFSRTLRGTFNIAGGYSVEATDHNVLANMALVGGQGFRTGLVVGATDFKTSAEYDQLDQTRYLDQTNQEKSEKRRLVGLPINYDSLRATAKHIAEPDRSGSEQYLECGSLVNTVYSLFEIDKQHYLKPQSSNQPLKPLDKLLSRNAI